MDVDVADEEDIEWDEVEATGDGVGVREDVEIVLPSSALAPLKKKKGQAVKRRNPYLDPDYRMLRLDLHRVHLLCHLLSAHHICSFLTVDGSPLLLARILSQIPSSLANSFTSFNPTTHPNERDRSRLFDSAVKDLAFWWWETWDMTPEGTGEVRVWSFAEGQEKAKAFDWAKWSEGKSSPEEWPEVKERIQGEKSLMKRAVKMKGSRDMMAYLFAGALRALDVPCRVVVSLQAVDYKGGHELDKEKDDKKNEESASRGMKRRADHQAPSSERSIKTRRLSYSQAPSTSSPPVSSNAASMTSSEQPDFTNGEEEDGGRRPSMNKSISTGGAREKRKKKGKKMSDIGVAPASMRRLGAKVGIKLRNSNKIPTVADMVAASMSNEPPPTVWVEVYSRSSKEWVTVDVTRNKYRCQNSMEPPAGKTKVGGNRMLYVVALEEDGHVKDLTPKYTKAFATEIVQLRPPPMYKRHGKQRVYEDWYRDRVVKPLSRRFKLTRDEKEDIELSQSARNAPMPSSLAGFKNHPLYVLERDLLRDQVLPPEANSIGSFRGIAVYPRTAVLSLKSAENWMREGMRVVQGEQPLKMVKMRAVTIERRRQIESAGEDALQGLYSRDQVEEVVPDPVIDGKVPKNSYGNVDLFAPHMLPPGSVHLPYRGIAKVAKRLGIDYGDAVTGFEFHKRRATPTLDGIVVPVENRELVLDAYWAAEQAAQEKELTKRQERSLKHWKKLILGLQVRQHVETTYKSAAMSASALKPTATQRPSQLKQLELRSSEEREEEESPRPSIGSRINNLSLAQLPDTASKPAKTSTKMVIPIAGSSAPPSHGTTDPHDSSSSKRRKSARSSATIKSASSNTTSDRVLRSRASIRSVIP
ncbi:Rad4-domain-containing protein [Atractiella rhizophila]|nr:Rad4-domain-containing protein [Atractiella rhizophila]